MAIGSKFAYATDRPLEDAIGPAIKYNEQMGFKYREEAEKAKEKQDAIKKANQEIPELKATTTPYSNRNAFIYDTLNKLKTGMVEKQRLADLGKISQQESNLFKQNALQNIDLLNQSSKRITDLNANMAKLISEEKVADGFEKDALALGGAVDKNQLHPEVNPDGTLNITVYDVDANGKKRILDSGGLDKIGEVAYTPVRNVKFEDYLKQFRETHPIDFTEKIQNNQKIGVKQLTPRLENSINDYADALLADKDALAVAYKNATGNVKRDITDIKDIQIAKDYLTDYIKKSYNEELNVDEAYQGANYRRQLAQDKKDEIKIGVADFGEYKTDDFLSNDKTIYRVGRKFVLPKEVTFPESKLTFKNLGGDNSDLNAGYVTSITKDKEGRFIVSGKAVKQKNIKYKGQDVPAWKVVDEASNGDTEAQSALSGFGVGDIYGRFTRRVPQDEVSSIILKTPLKTLENLNNRINELNKEEIRANKSAPKQKKKIKGF